MGAFNLRLHAALLLLLATTAQTAGWVKPLPPFSATIRQQVVPLALPSHRLRIDVLTLPAHGHYLTIRDVAIALALRGHVVRFLLCEQSRGVFAADRLQEEYGIEFVSAGPCPAFEGRHAVMQALAGGRHGPRAVDEMLKGMSDVAQEMCEALYPLYASSAAAANGSASSAGPLLPDALVFDADSYCGMNLALAFGLPYVPRVGTGLRSGFLAPSYTPPYTTGWAVDTGLWGRLVHTLVGQVIDVLVVPTLLPRVYARDRGAMVRRAFRDGVLWAGDPVARAAVCRATGAGATDPPPGAAACPPSSDMVVGPLPLIHPPGHPLPLIPYPPGHPLPGWVAGALTRGADPTPSSQAVLEDRIVAALAFLPSLPWDGAPTLYNTHWGLEVPRPLEPFEHVIGHTTDFVSAAGQRIPNPLRLWMDADAPPGAGVRREGELHDAMGSDSRADLTFDRNAGTSHCGAESASALDRAGCGGGCRLQGGAAQAQVGGNSVDTLSKERAVGGSSSDAAGTDIDGALCRVAELPLPVKTVTLGPHGEMVESAPRSSGRIGEDAITPGSAPASATVSDDGIVASCGATHIFRDAATTAITAASATAAGVTVGSGHLSTRPLAATESLVPATTTTTTAAAGSAAARPRRRSSGFNWSWLHGSPLAPDTGTPPHTPGPPRCACPPIRPLVFVSLGTLAVIPQGWLGAFASALRAQGPCVRFLWAVPAQSQAQLPEGLVTRGQGLLRAAAEAGLVRSRSSSSSGAGEGDPTLIDDGNATDPGTECGAAELLVVDWVPQVSVLQHAAVAAFITHGGMNSVGEATFARVPVLCLPMFSDQPDNCARVGERGMGVAMAWGDATAPGALDGALGQLLEGWGGGFHHSPGSRTTTPATAQSSQEQGSDGDASAAAAPSAPITDAAASTLGPGSPSAMHWARFHAAMEAAWLHNVAAGGLPRALGVIEAAAAGGFTWPHAAIPPPHFLPWWSTGDMDVAAVETVIFLLILWALSRVCRWGCGCCGSCGCLRRCGCGAGR